MTCQRCFSGRHCRGIGCDTCSVCSIPKAKARKKYVRRPRTTEERRRERPPSKKAVVGFRTTLDESDLPVVEFLLACTGSMAETARRMGVTRDKVRTVRDHAA